METEVRETKELEPVADRKEDGRIIIDLRIEAPPLTAVARGKMSVSNVVQSHCATLNV